MTVNWLVNAGPTGMPSALNTSTFAILGQELRLPLSYLDFFRRPLTGAWRTVKKIPDACARAPAAMRAVGQHFFRWPRLARLEHAPQRWWGVGGSNAAPVLSSFQMMRACLL